MPTLELESIQRLTRDLKQAATLLGRREAMYLVDTYYQIQDFRIASGHQHLKATEAGEPSRVLSWTNDALGTLENDIKRALGAFAAEYRVGRCGAKVIAGSRQRARSQIDGKKQKISAKPRGTQETSARCVATTWVRNSL